MSSRYIALIADAVDSRDLPAAARRRLQTDVRAAVPALNRRWHRALAARFAVTLGDELQCLLTSAAAAWDIAHDLRYTLGTVEWVVACGLGPISTPLASTAPEVDGPCFHAARAALEAAKRRRVVFALGAFPPHLAPLEHYYSALYWSWTKR